MDDRLPTRPYVARAVRLLSQPRRSPADSALVTAVALRLAALDSDSETAEKLVAAADRVIGGVAGLVGEQVSASDWGDTADALAQLIAGRPLQRGHLTAARNALGSADKVVDLSDRLRRTADEPVDRDDLGRALAMMVTGPADIAQALVERENGDTSSSSSTHATHSAHSAHAAHSGETPSAPRQAGRRNGAPERSVPLRAVDGGMPGR
ncbi:hypothetical protein EF847_04480 [Actinobacteria bacterium YIM 96077]|uniref:Uncharacterized protein n=1 Tax=Phytoactinopolyspora halophila TaxID=1981511 RepID=A0A329R6M8_9ACTN|nr:hypothetical protein [Phytoactinopolyspora halophila]AYY12078.1 hypothetical protein EF847_04480 [Actinobacteria bacterium YIM 96077]RAW18688.1 hypothetical protein DPM12_01030 [Phytoactinopolyspora halophila]